MPLFLRRWIDRKPLSVADHKITVTPPPHELGRKDLILDVVIDGEKQGELRLSEGGLDWWPRNAKTKKRKKTCSQLRDFMES